MKFVMSFVGAVMLMGIVGCTTAALPQSELGASSQKAKFAWGVKVSRGTFDEKPICFFNWTLIRISGSKKEMLETSNMMVTYDCPAVFSQKRDGKEMEVSFTIKKLPNGAGDSATCKFKLVLPHGSQKEVIQGKRMEHIPASLKKPLVFYFPKKPE